MLVVYAPQKHAPFGVRMLRGAGGHVTIPMGCSQRFYGLGGAGKGHGRGRQRMSTEWCEGEGPWEADIG